MLRSSFYCSQDYYEKSYGNDISGPLACTALQHIFTSMDEAKKAHDEGDTETYVNFKDIAYKTSTSLIERPYEDIVPMQIPICSKQL